MIDGSAGEGGGQVLRTGLALSLVTGKEFRIQNVRAGRPKPGLRAQHLAAVRAAAAVGAAEVEGDSEGSRAILFRPGMVRGGKYEFSVGTAGSTGLVLQTVLPALMMAEECSELLLEGGTHNPLAPPLEFLRDAYLPLLNHLGPRVEVDLIAHGFYPAGGGRIRACIRPMGSLKALHLPDRGEVRCVRAMAIVARLPLSVAQRETSVIAEALALPADRLQALEVADSPGPGNAVLVSVECAHVTEVFSAFGERGVPAEEVAGRVAKEAREFLDADVPVGRHLADQLLLPLALAGAGLFRTLEPSPHTLTNIGVLRQFLDIPIALTSEGDRSWRVEVGGAASP